MDSPPLPPPPNKSDHGIGSAAAIPADPPAPLHPTALTHPPYDVVSSALHFPLGLFISSLELSFRFILLTFVLVHLGDVQSKFFLQMIFEAMEAMKSPTTRKAISDYIQQTYTGLPENHSSFLTHHLRGLKASGRIVKSNISYWLPQPGGGESGRKRGRPPMSQAAPLPSHKQVVLGLSDDAARMKGEVAVNKPLKLRSGRGRPPKKQRSRSLVEVVLQARGAGRLKRGRGRPPKVTRVPFANEEVGPCADAGPQFPRSNGAADQPKQNHQAAAFGDQYVRTFEYELLQKKVEVIQTRIKDAAAVLKHHFVGEASTNVRAAIIEMEAIAALDIMAPLTVDLNAMPS
ncbi:hypothetical protein SAY87_003300 [Trapa incisa]|uniref:H15 domain-containing protein n=1 Tax=Trapa incisa TaxID=236973 RepID=A0AAN7KIX5_9MYRT|nr:hypothetical protein SAY87_003300 [Trapa incisa]